MVKLKDKKLYSSTTMEVKTKFTQAEVRALQQFVEDIRELCDLDEDLDVEIGNDVDRIAAILEVDYNAK